MDTKQDRYNKDNDAGNKKNMRENEAPTSTGGASEDNDQ